MKIIVGQTLLNQFRVEAFIAACGMGAVYRVRDLKRNVPLAMKVLHADLADDPTVFKLFQREANALKNLAHPHIVPFYGIYQSGDLVFLLQHFVDGYSLKEILRQHKGEPLPINEVLVYLKALSAALGYAHVRGVVHCDVKPGNVMVDRGGNIYLADFGIARHAESTRTSLGVAGAPAYMAPEQIRGEAVTAATDVYATGVMLFEMLTGRRPFRGDEQETVSAGVTTGERIRIAHLTLSPPDPRRFNPSLPPALSQIILKALEKDAQQRFRKMGEMLIGACNVMGTNPARIPERVFSIDIVENPSEHPPGVPIGNLPVSRSSEITAKDTQSIINQFTSRVSGVRLAFLLSAIVISILLAFFVFSINLSPTQGVITIGTATVTSTLPEVLFSTHNPGENELIETTTPNPISQASAVSTVSSSDPTGSETPPSPRRETPFPTPQPYFPITGCAGSRLQVGDWAYVSFGGGANFIRTNPDVHPDDNIIGSALEGEPMEIISGPECSYGWLIWEVRSAHGLWGWTAESDGEALFLIPGITWKSCPNAPPSRLMEIERAMVSLYPEIPNKIRKNPDTSADAIGEINPGQEIKILNGPSCMDGYVWWEVGVIGDQLRGWTAEGDHSNYWLVPIPQENR